MNHPINPPAMNPGERVQLARELRGTLEACKATPSYQRRAEMLLEALEWAIKRIEPELTAGQVNTLKTLAKGRPSVAPKGWPDLSEQGIKNSLDSLERRNICDAEGNLTDYGRNVVKQVG